MECRPRASTSHFFNFGNKINKWREREKEDIHLSRTLYMCCTVLYVEDSSEFIANGGLGLPPTTT